MAGVSVLIPFGGTDPHREAALRWLLPRLPESWEVVVGHHDSPVWCKAAAVADALHRSHGDLLVIHDADVWSPDTSAFAELVQTWGMPHRHVHRLSPSATIEVLEGAEPSPSMEHNQTPYVGVRGGGIVAVRRDIYEQVPLDPRFQVWGQEDESWAHALTTLIGPLQRLAGDLFHLWHPPPQRMNRSFGNEEGRELAYRYVRAARNPTAMRQLLEEVNACQSTPPSPSSV